MRKIYKYLEGEGKIPGFRGRQEIVYLDTAEKRENVNKNTETPSATISTGTTFVLYHSGFPK